MEQPLAIQELSNPTSFVTDPQLQLSPNQEVEEEFEVTPYRWLVLIFTSTGLVASVFVQIGFSAIASDITEIYDCSNFLVVMCDLVFYLGLVIMTIPVVKIVDSRGIRFSLILASLSTIIGCWLRQFVMINNNFVLVFVFTIPPAFVQVFYMNLTAKIPNLWLAEKERVLGTSIIGMAQPLGALLGFGLPTIFVNSNTSEDPESQQVEDFNEYLLLQNIMVTLLALPIVFIIRERPSKPPSEIAFKEAEALDIKACLKKLFLNKNYILFVVNFTCFQTLYASFAATVSYLAEPYDYSSGEVAIISLAFIVFGVAGAVLFGMFLDRKRKFKLVIILISFGTLVFVLFAFYALPLANVYVMTIDASLIGLMVIPSIPVAFSFSVQISYPIPETMSNGMMLMVAQLVAFGISMLVTAQAEINPLYGIGTFTVLAAIAAGTSIFVKEDLRLYSVEGNMKEHRRSLRMSTKEMQ